MSSLRARRLTGMSETTNTPTTVTNLGVAMFTVKDQDAAARFYTETMGWEVRADVTFGENGESRWLEVAPPGSTARLALNPPMGHHQPGGGGIGIETTDIDAEYARLSGIEGIEVNPPMDAPGAPRLFMMSDPDGNAIAVVEVPEA
jgi:lactoylglutathione lyase